MSAFEEGFSQCAHIRVGIVDIDDGKAGGDLISDPGAEAVGIVVDLVAATEIEIAHLVFRADVPGFHAVDDVVELSRNDPVGSFGSHDVSADSQREAHGDFGIEFRSVFVDQAVTVIIEEVKRILIDGAVFIVVHQIADVWPEISEGHADLDVSESGIVDGADIEGIAVHREGVEVFPQVFNSDARGELVGELLGVVEPESQAAVGELLTGGTKCLLVGDVHLVHVQHGTVGSEGGGAVSIGACHEIVHNAGRPVRMRGQHLVFEGRGKSGGVPVNRGNVVCNRGVGFAHADGAGVHTQFEELQGGRSHFAEGLGGKQAGQQHQSQHDDQ